MAEPKNKDREVWITGIGLVSSLGEGLEAHWQALNADRPKPVVDKKTFAPCPIHPICEIDYSKQIPKRGDLRQMEDWQRIGTYAAGLALDDAGIKGNEELLAKCHIIAAAGNGERDPQADATVLDAIKDDPDWREKLNQLLLDNLRPTLYLAQQTQLLAGNISIVHKVSGGSRTYKGEEIAGVQIFENAVQRIKAGQGDLFLVGAANNAARPDLIKIRSINRAFQPLGSMGVFMVVERAGHARSRGARPLALLSGIQSKAEGMSQAGEQVHTCSLRPSDKGGQKLEYSRNPALAIGHGVEAQFPAAMALALLCLEKGRLYQPFSHIEQAHEDVLKALMIDLQSASGAYGEAILEQVEV